MCVCVFVAKWLCVFKSWEYLMQKWFYFLYLVINVENSNFKLYLPIPHTSMKGSELATAMLRIIIFLSRSRHLVLTFVNKNDELTKQTELKNSL